MLAQNSGPVITRRKQRVRMMGENDPSTLEDLAVSAKGGMETLRLALQRLYMARASAYRDALRSFIGGYQEGIQQVMEKKEKEDPDDDTET